MWINTNIGQQTWALYCCIVAVGAWLRAGLEAPVQTLLTSGTLCTFYHYGTTALTKVGTTLCHSTWKEMFALNKQFESQLIPDLCYSGNANSSYTFVTVQIGCITNLKWIGCRVRKWWPHTLSIEAQELLLHQARRKAQYCIFNDYLDAHLLWRIQAAYKQQQHLVHPIHGHRPFPMCCWNTSPPSLRTHLFR